MVDLPARFADRHAGACLPGEPHVGEQAVWAGRVNLLEQRRWRLPPAADAARAGPGRSQP